jgi:sirohydrochlorin cobaltochelatase
MGEGTARPEIHFAPPLGSHQGIIELSAAKYHEAIAASAAGYIPESDTLLLLVGRGSRDDEATAEMFTFARLRLERTPVGQLEVCFIAMAEPSFQATLARVAEQTGCRRVVVQPHLLFAGELLAQINSQVAEVARARPDVDWIVTGHLGPDPSVTRAVLDRSNYRGPLATAR